MTTDRIDIFCSSGAAIGTSEPIFCIDWQLALSDVTEIETKDDIRANMALRLKKDIKKASYYVWFLGARESRGLRGEEYALPAIAYLDERARDLEPFKVTLQVSHKGLKIIQNVTAKGKQQTIKHFIPHGSVTSVVLQGDVVACVLLLYNPITGCPVHVHVYRCDSEHTAELLHAHLQALVDRPENQKKFADIERKLRQRGALPNKPPDSSLGSEVSTRESDSGSTEERCVANLYDSLAAELKQKLSTGKRGIGKSPILLPPRDYDTVHRQKGNLSNIDTRRCLNQNIVGVNARRKLESSGGSSGIGSDLAPSPDRNDYRHNDNHSTSEEEWAESTAYMMHEAYDASPPRRTLTPPRQYHDSPPRARDRHDPYRERRQRQPSPERDHERYDGAQRRLERDHERDHDERRTNRLQRGVSEGSLQLADASPRDRFHVAKEKFMNLERERFTRELEIRMAQRRSVLEARARSPASPAEERRPERLPRLTHARAAPAPLAHAARYDDEPEFERYERERYERRRDEPEERSGARREWRAGAGADGRQRAFSRSRLLDEQRQQRQSYAEERPYYEREFRDLPERAPAKFRHSYAEPLARARLPALRPY